MVLKNFARNWLINILFIGSVAIAIGSLTAIAGKNIFIIPGMVGGIVILLVALNWPEIFVALALGTNFLKSFFIPGLVLGQFGVTPYMGFIALALIGCSYQIFVKKRRFILPVGWPFLFFFMAITTVSLFPVRDFTSVFGVYVRTVLDWLLMFLLIQMLVNRDAFQKIINVLLVQALVVVGWGIYAGMVASGTNLQRQFFWQQFQKNDFAAYLAVVLVLALATLLVGQTRRQKLLALVLLPMVPIAWVFTFSRGGFLAIGIATIVFFVLERNKKQLKKMVQWLLILCIIIAVSFSFMPQTIKVMTIDSLRSLAGEQVANERFLDTIDVRIELLKTAAQIVIEHPIIGVGFNQWQYYSPITEQTIDKQTGERKTVGFNIHNRYLIIAVNQGTLALFSYWGFLILVVVSALKARQYANPSLRPYLHAFLAALVGIQLAMQFAPTVLWEWPVLGLLIGIINIVRIDFYGKLLSFQSIRLKF